MLKAWERFQDFLLFKLQNTHFGTGLLEMLKKKEIKSTIEDLSNVVKQNKTWAQLEKLIKEEDAAKLQAKEIRNPSINTNEEKGPSTWFSSPVFKEMAKKFDENWEKAVSSKSKLPNDVLSEHDFTEMAQFARFNVMLVDKNRNNSFEFSNKQYIMALKLWFPENYSFENDQLPPDWDIHKPQARPHDCLQIKKSGTDAGAKMGSVLTLGGIVKDLCAKYRDVKVKIFGEEPLQQNFFVNYKQKELAPLTNTRGSLLSKYSRAIGVDHATVNSVRRSLESFLRKNPDKIDPKRIQTVQSHSNEVGLAYYDRGAGDYRSGIVHKLSKVEGSHSNDAIVPEEVAAQRAQREEEDQKIREKASAPSGRLANISKTAKLLPEDRLFLQRLLTAEKYCSHHPIKSDSQFPGD